MPIQRSVRVRQALPVKVSDDLWNVLERAQRLARPTDGAFDVTVGPVVRLWRLARKSRRMPAGPTRPIQRPRV